MKLLCFGDSNTWGFDPRLPFGGRYSAPWPQILARLSGHTVLNCGENGRTIPSTDHAIALMDRLLREQAPDRLLLMLGTNDILSLFPGNPAAVGQRMEGLLTHLKATVPALPILLLAPPPAALPVDSEALAAVYAAIARRLEVDFSDAGTWDTPLAFDGVHFTEEGHLRFARRILNLI